MRCDGSVKIAIVHDWLMTYAGAERVLEQMLRCYPQADAFLGTHQRRKAASA